MHSKSTELSAGSRWPVRTPVATSAANSEEYGRISAGEYEATVTAQDNMNGDYNQTWDQTGCLPYPYEEANSEYHALLPELADADAAF